MAREHLKNWCGPSPKIDFVWFAVDMYIFFSVGENFEKKAVIQPRGYLLI